MKRLSATWILAVLLSAVGVSQASAETAVDRAARSLRQDPVFVDPGAERALSPTDASRLRDEVRASTKPIFVAVLPAAALAEVGGSADDLPGRLARAVGSQGTYGVVVGNSFRATSSAFAPATAAGLATAAFQQHASEGTVAVLADFVNRVSNVRVGSAARSTPTTAGGGGGSSGTAVALLLGLVVIGVVGVMVLSRRRRRRDLDLVDETRGQLRAEAQALGDDVISLEPMVTTHPEARLDYDTAVSRFKAADASLDSVRSERGAEQLRRLLAEGRYSMSRVRARVDGYEPPPPPPELAAPGPHGEPAVVLNDQGQPDYHGNAGRWHGGGWLPGAAGGVVGGLLLGRLFGGGGGWGGGGGGWGWGGDYDRGDYDGGFDGGGGFDDGGGGGGGGGDWGGGGGDWGGGGGDAGGGDWGG